MTETRDERRDRKRAAARGVEQFREHIGDPAPLAMTPQAVYVGLHRGRPDAITDACPWPVARGVHAEQAVVGGERTRLRNQMQRLFRSSVELPHETEHGIQVVAGHIASRMNSTCG